MPSPSILPTDLGLPAKFTSWRPGQFECVQTAATTDKRFIACSIPTGGGKSLFSIASAIITGGRSVYVTSSKGLQDQLYSDFSECGLTDMRGRQNYPCVRGHGTTCSEGRMLECRDSRCSYNSSRSDFLESPLGSTNYSYYLTSIMHSEGIGKVDLLILDEAHAAIQELSSAIEIKLHHASYNFLYNIIESIPPFGKPLAIWRTWAKYAHPKAIKHFQELKQKTQHKYLSITDRFVTTLEQISNVPESWILDESNSAETLISPLWPTEYAEKYLFQSVKSIILSSATLVPKTLDLLGIKQEDSLFITQDHTFSPARSPVYIFPHSRVDFKMSEGDWQSTVGRMDTFISRRLDRKGMIHCVSYHNKERILKDSIHRGIMIAPRRASEFSAAVEEYRKSASPRILISPAATTGYDFPGDQCEYTVILKLPFIDGRSPIMKARSEHDPEYLSYLTAQTLVQTCGRGMRSNEDQNETLVLDAHANWFLGKKERGGFRYLLPPWFMRQIQYPSNQPVPPPPLSRGS